MRLVGERTLRPCSTLEVGCGTGANAIYLSRQRFEVTAVDSSPLALERARLRCEQEGGLVRFVLADIYDFAKNAERFDLVLDVGFYHFARRRQLAQFLDLLWWVTRPGSYYLTLAGATGEAAVEGGPPQVSEEEIRSELGRLFQFVHVRPMRFESPLRGEGFLGWSCLLRRPQL
jgi:SAM-dependent methyltransferase